MYGALAGIWSSKGTQAPPPPPGEFTFYTEDVDQLLPLLLSSPPNNLFYFEVVDGSLGLDLRAPPNNLFYFENIDNPSGLDLRAPPTTQFYSENMDANTILVLSQSDHLELYTENDSVLLDLTLGYVGSAFFSFNEDGSNYTATLEFAPGGEDTLFFSVNDASQVVPLQFG